MIRWYAVHSQPRAERTAFAHLQRQGFAAYLPIYLRQRRHARKVELASAPLFPRYLFVHMDLTATRWQAIHSTVGVVRLVCHGADPAPVPNGVIEDIRGREDDSGMVRVAPKFVSGQRVIVESGAFADQIGFFDRVTDDERVVILLSLLGRELRVRLPAAVVRAAA